MSERAENRLLLQMQGVIAEYERAKIIERTRRGKLHKIRAGQSLPYSREAPYGYAVMRGAEVGTTIVVDEVEAQNVREMYRWVLDEELSARGVAIRLKAQGVRPRRAQKWNKGVVYGILTNPAYVGQAAYGRIECTEPKRPKTPGAYRKKCKSSHRVKPREQWLTFAVPPIVDESTQQRVRDALARNKIVSPRNVQHEYLLRTLVVCGGCGHRMAAEHTLRRSYEYFFYSCKSYNDVRYHGDEQKCHARRVRRDELDGVVWDAVVTWIQSPEMLRREVEAWRMSDNSAAKRTQDLSRLENTARRLQGQIERLVDAYQAGGITVEELKARRERLEEEEKRAADVRREELEAQEMDQARLDQLGEDLAAFAATLRDGLDKLDFQGRQRLVRLLIERVVVTGDHIAIEHAILLSGRFSGLRHDRVSDAAVLHLLDTFERKRRARAIADEALASFVILGGDTHRAVDIEAVARCGEALLLALVLVTIRFFRHGPLSGHRWPAPQWQRCNAVALRRHIVADCYISTAAGDGPEGRVSVEPHRAAIAGPAGLPTWTTLQHCSVATSQRCKLLLLVGISPSGRVSVELRPRAPDGPHGGARACLARATLQRCSVVTLQRRGVPRVAAAPTVTTRGGPQLG